MRRTICSFLITALALALPAHAQPAKPAAEPKPAAAPAQPDPKPFSVEGVYVEACTCRGTCQGEITGEPTGCDVVGACLLNKAAYDGHDISGTRLAFALDHGDQLHLYLDAPDAAKRTALEAFARAAFAGYGKVQSVSQAKIELSGADGAYTVKIDGGKTMTLATEPVFGGDHKTAIAIDNTQHPLNPTLRQAHCVSCTYADGEHKITIEKGRNSFFNQSMKAAGKI